jgi:hypothetical protein
VLSELELDFDLEVTGFEMAEIDVLIDGLEMVYWLAQTYLARRTPTLNLDRSNRQRQLIAEYTSIEDNSD